MPLLDLDATLQVIQQKLDGTKVWLAEWSAVAESLFLPTGKLDWRDQGAAPDSPPPTRVRSFVVDRVLQFVDENGLLGSKGELIGTDASGIRRVLPPRTPGSVLILDPSEELGFQWADVVPTSEVAGEYQYGRRLSYNASASAVASQIQYTKIFVAQDTPISSMTCYRRLGGLVSRFVNMGIYDQADPTDKFGTPRNLIDQTGAVVTTGANSYITAPLLAAPFVVPTTGYYWLAFITDTPAPLTFQVTGGSAYPTGFLPVYEEASAGTTLPLVATPVQVSSAVLFVAALE